MTGRRNPRPAWAVRDARRRAARRGLGFVDPFIAVAGDVLQEQVDAFEDLAALLLPSEVVLPGVVVSNESLRRSPGEANEPGAA